MGSEVTEFAIIERPAAPEIISPGALTPAADPVRLLLKGTRSDNTRRTYAKALTVFFGGEPDTGALRAFAAAPPEQIALQLEQWKDAMLERGLSESTVNVRLSAVRSLRNICYRVGLAPTDARNLVTSEKVTPYRDTRGVDLETLKRLINCPAREGLKGARDRAILRLLAETALRRAELCALDVADLDAPGRQLSVLGKGRGTQKEPMTLSAGCVAAIEAYLTAAGHRAGALFRNCARFHQGERLTPAGLYQLVRHYGAQVGCPKLRPHGIRHSAITAALDATSGDVRKVQKFSRHRSLDVLLKYDDSRQDHAGDVTRRLSRLLGED